MSLSETHFHLNHLPPIDQYFINEAQNAVYSWPSVDYPPGHPITSQDSMGNLKDHGTPTPTPNCVQHGIPINGQRHTLTSRTIQCIQSSSFINTKFASDLQKSLGKIKTRYLYNPPWSLYDWHQDLAGHKSCINFLLTDTPNSKTLHRFPTECRLNYQVEVTEYRLYYPLLFNTRIDHCIINLTNQHRYILQILLFDSTYQDCKEYLKNYNLDTPGYL